MALPVPEAHKIKATGDLCDEWRGVVGPLALALRCGSVLLEVVFNKGKSPLPDGATERKACLVCDAPRHGTWPWPAFAGDLQRPDRLEDWEELLPAEPGEGKGLLKATRCF